MRKEFLIENYNGIEDFMRDAAPWLRSINDGEVLLSGCNLQVELSEEEKSELSKYIYEIACAYADREVKKIRDIYFTSIENKEDFLQNLCETIVRELHKFNDKKHLTDKSKQYCFSTFINKLIYRVERSTTAKENNLTDEQEKDRRKILRAMEEISQETGMEVTMITPEMTEKKLGRRYKESTIHYLLSASQAKADIDVLPEEKLSSDSDLLRETRYAKELEEETKKKLNVFMQDLDDIDKFFVLLKLLNEDCYDVFELNRDYSTMTDKQLSVDNIFLNMVKADKKASKNLRKCDVTIQRPDHCASNEVIEIYLQDVENVNVRMIEYRNTKAEENIKKFREIITGEEILKGGVVEYLSQEFSDLLDKYRNM